MIAKSLEKHPDYQLIKQNDVVSFFHLQLPRWLLEDNRYSGLSLEAKFVYTLLFNRFQLSKYNGWVNGNGEVFIIYTRRELAKCLNIGEKRVSSAMVELKEQQLIWEKRCGRGCPNHIYLAMVVLGLEDSLQSEGNPLDVVDCSGIEGDEMAVLDESAEVVDGAGEMIIEGENADFPAPTDISDCEISENHDCLEPPKTPFKNSQSGVARTADSAVLEPPNRPPSIKDKSQYSKDINSQSHSQCQRQEYAAPTGDCQESSPSVAKKPEAKTKNLPDNFLETHPSPNLIHDSEETELSEIFNKCELDYLESQQSAVMRDAIERLYYSQYFKIGNAVYPQSKIRENLNRLDIFILQDVLDRLGANMGKIRNSSAYVTTVLFNTIMETGSDLIVDPYLNFLRNSGKQALTKGGG